MLVVEREKKDECLIRRRVKTLKTLKIVKERRREIFDQGKLPSRKVSSPMIEAKEGCYARSVGQSAACN